MVAENIYLPVSGTIIGGSVFNHTASMVILCGIANGSVMVPLQADAAGQLATT